MKSDLLFCFGHKKGKSMVKRMNLKWITLKKSESLFHKEWIAPVTFYLKTTFSPVALNKKSCELLLLLFNYEKSEKIKRAKSERAKEQIPNPASQTLLLRVPDSERKNVF